MTRRCGNCLFTDRNGESVVCFGGPPNVMSATPDGQGGTKVQSQAPVLPTAHRACSLHAYRFGPRALMWKLTGGA